MSSLVAYCGSSDEEDDVEMELEEPSSSGHQIPVSVTSSSQKNGASPTPVPVSTKFGVEVRAGEGFDGDILLNEGEPSSSSSSLKLDKVLPKPKNSLRMRLQDLEEIGPIPQKKIYGDEELLKPKPSTFHNLTTNKTAKGVVQISIPSLKNFVDDEKIELKRKVSQGSQKGCGLFALLPEPKNITMFQTHSIDKNIKKSASDESSWEFTKTSSSPSTSVAKPRQTAFVPQAVQQGLSGKRPAANERLAFIRAKYLKQEANIKIVSKSKTDVVPTKTGDDDSEGEDDGTKDFFSLDRCDTFEASSNLHLEPKSQASIQVNIHPDVEEANPIAMEEEVLIPAQEPVPLEEPDLMKYIQPAKKGRGKVHEINIIDVNADDLRPATNDWLKTITDTSMIPPRKANLPGGMTKKKHQITYLAAEAKAREEELQNQWAQNRNARRQTQNKYGF